jgi:asparagine synthase (glutamine-hydrolysing)
MCGVIALVGVEEIDERSLGRASSALGHRGIDGEGVWISSRKICGLGSRRLSFNDLTGGHQPLVSRDQRLAIVVNGEFYEFQQLRAELIKRGHSFKTGSDSEILMPLYLEHGVNCLQYLRGEFAFALWDERNQSLFVARDRFGVKPLFYGWAGRTLVIGSEAKALFAAGVPAQWDRESYIDHVLLCHGPQSTLFKGVKQVPPGHFLIYRNGVLSLTRYWDMEFPSMESSLNWSYKNDNILHEHADAVHSALADAVNVRLQADVPIGYFLSGGLDSAAVLGMSRNNEQKTAFTVKFEEEIYDESASAQATAKHFGATWVPLLVTLDDMIASWEKAVWHGETIADNARGVARMLQSKGVRDAGFKAVLSGEGADELFAGYYFSRQDFLRSQTMLTGGSRAAERLCAPETNVAFRSSVAGGSAGTVPALEDRFGFTPSWAIGALNYRGPILGRMIAPEFTSNVSSSNVVERVLFEIPDPGRIKAWHPVHKSLFLWAKTMLPNMILVADRLEMAAPIESRVPFLDHCLFEIARKIPVTMLFSDQLEKYVLRQAVKHVVPPEVYSRQKQPFTAPHAIRPDNNPLDAFVGDLLHSNELVDCQFFDRDSVLAVYNETRVPERKDRILRDQALMLVAHTCLMQRAFKL